MTVQWTDVNDDKTIYIELEIPNINYFDWKRFNECYTDKDIIIILEDYLAKLNCTIQFPSGRPMMTTYPMYQEYKNMYYYYLLKLTNQYIYNSYLDKLCKREYENIIFELITPYIVVTNKKEKKQSSNKRVINKFVKAVTKDLFTNEEIYVYENLKTGEIIKSKNPNLLEELNKPKKKEKKQKVKVASISFDAMTFSFKK